jgi:methionyl aminopeptidase
MHFPKSVCTSVNEVICHGIPNKRVLRNGDWINLDVTLYLDGVHGDNSAMVTVGEVHPDVLRLIAVT